MNKKQLVALALFLAPFLLNSCKIEKLKPGKKYPKGRMSTVSDSAEIYLTQGIDFHDEDFEKAKESYEKALKFDEPIARYNLGVLYHDYDQFRRSIRELEQVVKLRPDVGDVYPLLGLNYLEIQNYKKAEENYLKAVKHGYHDDQTYTNLAFALLAQGKKEEAKKYKPEIGKY